MLLLPVVPPLKPILPHYRQQCFDGLSFSLLALTSPNFLEDVLPICLVKGVDVPGLPILDPVKIEIREHFHCFVHIGSYVICGLQDCPEKGLNYYLRFRFMVLEYNRAGLQSPPHRRHQNSINLYIPHSLLRFPGLQHPLLSYRHIHMFRVKFVLQILLSIFEQLLPVLPGQFCVDPVGQRLCVSDEVNHQFWFIIRY